jgi:hypothetical protein
LAGRHYNVANLPFCLKLCKVFVLAFEIVLLDEFLNVDEVGGYLANWLLETWVLHCHLDLFGHIGNIFAPVAAVDHSIVLKHLNHVLGQL